MVYLFTVVVTVQLASDSDTLSVAKLLYIEYRRSSDVEKATIS